MDLKSNIKKYNYFHFVRFFIFFVPIVVLFLQENGLSLRQIFLLQTVYAIIILVMEVPSGFFADVYGRKITLVLGSAAIAISAGVYANSYSFFGFLIAELLWGLGGSFISGADTALLYDSLVDLKKRKEYKRIEGHAHFLGRVSEAIAAVLGGFLALISLRTVMYATIVPFVILFFVSLTLKEPKRHIKIHEKGHLHHVYKIIKFALHQNKTIKWIILYSATLVSMLYVAFWFYQPYFQLVGVPVVYFGLIFAGINLFSGISLKYSHIYEKKLGLKFALISFPIIMALAFFILGKFVVIFSIIFVLLFQFVRGTKFIIVSDAINKIVWSDKRATVLSLNNMAHRFLFAIISPFMGWFADIYTIPTALMLSGIIVLVGGGLTLGMLYFHKVF